MRNRPAVYLSILARRSLTAIRLIAKWTEIRAHLPVRIKEHDQVYIGGLTRRQRGNNVFIDGHLSRACDKIRSQSTFGGNFHG